MDITSLNSLYPRNTLDTQEHAKIIYYSDDVVHTKYISFFIFLCILSNSKVLSLTKIL